MKNNKALQEGSHQESKIDFLHYSCLRFAFFISKDFTVGDIFPSQVVYLVRQGDKRFCLDKHQRNPQALLHKGKAVVCLCHGYSEAQVQES